MLVSEDLGVPGAMLTWVADDLWIEVVPIAHVNMGALELCCAKLAPLFTGPGMASLADG